MHVLFYFILTPFFARVQPCLVDRKYSDIHSVVNNTDNLEMLTGYCHSDTSNEVVTIENIRDGFFSILFQSVTNFTSASETQ